MQESPFNLFPNEYEAWFRENENTFQSELLALKQAVPVGKKGIEIGIGSGIFAGQLGIQYGIDPSDNMLEYARKRNLKVEKGFAEDLPYPDNSFDFAVFITSLCFITNPAKAIREVHRILRPNGEIIIAFIDKESTLGQILEKGKDESKFYRDANFYSVPEMIEMIENNDFKVSDIFQTLTELNNEEIESPIEGFGKGGFVVIKGRKTVFKDL
ncbi:MAG TPA: SAM-dependent methyltransferase [Prolixibacteraceae bacterium]|nr:SAM-dependent methyltransferase [Prolixibacteraceae bacterium]